MEFDYILHQCEFQPSGVARRPPMPAEYCGRCVILFPEAERTEAEFCSWSLDSTGPWNRVKRIAVAWGSDRMDACLEEVAGEGWVLSVAESCLTNAGQSSIALDLFTDDAAPIARLYLVYPAMCVPETAAGIHFPGGAKTLAVGPVWLGGGHSNARFPPWIGDSPGWLQIDDKEIRGVLEISGNPETLILETAHRCRFREEGERSLLLQPAPQPEIREETFHVALGALQPGSNRIHFCLRRPGEEGPKHVDQAGLDIIALPFKKDGMREDLDLQEEWLVPGFPVQRSFWISNASLKRMRVLGSGIGWQRRLVPLSVLNQPLERDAPEQPIPGQGLGQLRFRFKSEGDRPGKLRLVVGKNDIETTKPSFHIRMGRRPTIDDLEDIPKESSQPEDGA